MSNDSTYMLKAIDLAEKAGAVGEIPIGSVIVQNDKIIGEGFNSPIKNSDPSAHAELIAIRKAAKAMCNYRLPEATLYTTLEPCAMCAGAIVLARIKRVVIGARDKKAGAAGSVLDVIPNSKLNHKPEIIFGVCSDECSKLLTEFFAKLRQGSEL
ncbi:MAG: tRNA-specific adenosine deaminase [Candidatus Hydrogenedentes bacterium CG1_02_42_14]|nr:MAG: tRNA-specific adenosine deaminase [Candidatus Hydrogenedentes bacterium CG1_02_42_14]